MSTDTRWHDVSKYQDPVNDEYPHPFFSFKCSDGGDVDPNCAPNLRWSKAHCGPGQQMVGFAPYHVYRVGEDNFGGIKRALSTPFWLMALMLDLEDWEGEITGNQSSAMNKLREQCIAWLGGSRSRVFGYANTGNGNMQQLWPNHKDTKFVIPNYAGRPVHPDMIAHQHSDRVDCPPFGPCDANIAYDKTPAQWAAQLGLPNTSSTEDDMPSQVYLWATPTAKQTKIPEAGKWVTVGWDKWAPEGASGGASACLADTTRFFSTTVDLAVSDMPVQDNLYIRIQTLDRSGKQMGLFPVAEIRGTSGGTNFSYSRVGSVGAKTNLRVLVSATCPCTITQGWWRTLQW